jgi:hypothetical protein
MKIFISWSGGLSHEVALALREWLPAPGINQQLPATEVKQLDPVESKPKELTDNANNAGINEQKTNLP